METRKDCAIYLQNNPVTPVVSLKYSPIRHGGFCVSKNEAAIKAFCEQFTPPLKYVKSQRINNVVIPDAWQTSVWDQKTGLGIVVVVYNDGIHAYLEAAGPSDIAANAGKVFAKTLEFIRENGLYAGDGCKDIHASGG